MPIKFIRQDIAKIKCDAIVNPTDRNYSHGGGVDAAIHKAAGEKLYKACVKKGQLEVGKAVITDSFDLPCKYVIHTAGPHWKGGNEGEEKLLRSCYREALNISVENKCKSVAFPLIASGTFGFPKDRVLKIAVDEISSFLFENEMTVYIVVFDKTSYSISEKLFADIVEYIDDNYVDERELYCCSTICKNEAVDPEMHIRRRRKIAECIESKELLSDLDLDEKLRQLDESFSQMLLRKIDEKGITDAECYKKANIDRKLFSKIRSDVNYKPSKPTVIAFAISLELSLAETNDMLRKAGFALSHSNKFDVIIEYFISIGNYNVFEINEVLFKFDQSTLGA